MYEEKISTRKKERIELQHALKAATKGDRFVVYKLDRLARSTKELYHLTDEMSTRGVDFVSIHDHFDTTPPTGRAMFGMLAVFAEFERDIIQQRTKAGLEAARKRGPLADVLPSMPIRSVVLLSFLKVLLILRKSMELGAVPFIRY